MSRPALIASSTELAAVLPWLALGVWPTPVQRLERLGRRLGADLWVKQDNLSSPLYGGNKVRKLELLLGEAVARGCRSVVTVGGIGSSHVIATALFARELGLRTVAVLFPQPVTDQVRRTVALVRALDVELVLVGNRLGVPLGLRAARRRAECPFLIGPGGSSPLGTVGYVSAALELRQQIAAGLLPEPDDIFLPLGSGGTMAGLVLGAGLAGLRSRIVGVRVVERVFSNETLVRWLVRRTARFLRTRGLEPGRALGDLAVLHGYLGGCYGRATPAAESSRERAAETEGLVLETTYTAKAMAALIDHCGGEGRGRRLLFWNTHNSVDLERHLSPGAAPLPARIQAWLGRAGDPG